MACDAKMDPKDFRKSLWFKEKCMSIEAPQDGFSTCRSTCPKGEAIERTYDYVIVCRGLQGKLKHMEVVVDFESRPHEAVIFLVERDTEIHEPGYSGCEMPSRSKAERGTE